METTEPTVQERLESIKNAVRKATEQAMKDAAGESPMELQFNDPPGTSSTETSTENVDPNTFSESFALSMTLFGKDVSSIEREVRDKLDRVETELKDLVVAVDTSQEMSDNDTTDDPESLRTEAETLKARIRFLRECSSARSLLDEASIMSSSATAQDPDWVESARLLTKAQKALEHAQEVVRQEEEQATEATPAILGAYRILDAIGDAIRRKRVELLSKATSLLESSITLTPESITVRGGRMGPQAQGLHAAYDMLEAVSMDSTRLMDVLKRLTNRLYETVFAPVLDAHKKGTASARPWIFQDVSDGSTKGLTGRVTLTAKTVNHSLDWSRDENEVSCIDMDTSISKQESSITSWGETLKFIQRVLEFWEERVLLGRAPLCQYVGQRLFQQDSPTGNSLNLQAFGLESNLLDSDRGLIVKPTLQLLWDECIPSFLKSSELAQLEILAKKLKVYTDDFEGAMQSKHYLPDSTENPLPLSDFVSNFQRKYVEKRRCTLLNEARNLLLNTDYHNTVEVGVDVEPSSDNVLDKDDGMSVFKLHKSSVSQTSSLIMTLCRRTMDEAVSIQIENPSSPLAVLPATLYRTAREMLDLFRAIIPATHGGEVSTIPRTAAVLHNDCVFLAHHCLTLGLEYKEKFPPAQDDRGQLLRQTCMFVDMVPPFRELADRSLGDMLERQRAQLGEVVGARIPLLGHSLRSNESLAEWSEAETALKAGTYHLRHLSQAWKPILANEIFGRSMGYLGDAIFNMLIDQIMTATAISATACEFVSGLFQSAKKGVSGVLDGDTKACRLWDRFSAVGAFMDMSLADIQAALADGVFRSVTGPELSRLIMATFDESEKRNHLLQVLASHN